MEKNQELIKALEVEMESLSAKGIDIEDHKLTIEYLKTGVKLDADPDTFMDSHPLLFSAYNDFQCLLSDYTVKR